MIYDKLEVLLLYTRLLSHWKGAVKFKALALPRDLYCGLDTGTKSGVRGTPLVRSGTEARLDESDSLAQVQNLPVGTSFAVLCSFVRKEPAAWRLGTEEWAQS